ncbi:13041_t:CDS:2, partial [Cetraspora pellucida]
MSNYDLNVHVRLFLNDIQKRCKRLDNIYTFGIPEFRFLRVRVHGVIVKRTSEMLIIDDATATCRVNLGSTLHKRFDIDKLSTGTLITVTGELKETEGRRWIECEG